MPALTNIRVGSLCGTSGAEGTRAWPFFSKKSRNPRRMSLVEIMVDQICRMLQRGKDGRFTAAGRCARLRGERGASVRRYLSGVLRVVNMKSVLISALAVLSTWISLELNIKA